MMGSKSVQYWLSLLWKILLCIAEFVGLGLGSGLFEGTVKRRFPYMFTNLSNIAVLIYFVLAILWMVTNGTRIAGASGGEMAGALGIGGTLASGGEPAGGIGIGANGSNGAGAVFAPVAKHMVTMAVTVTFLISHFFLWDKMFEGGYLHVHLLFLHYITPIMTILDWLIFDAKGQMKIWEPLVWILGPLGYLFTAITAIEVFGSDFGADVAAGKSPYPYSFIDHSKIGWNGVATFVLAASAAFVVLGYLMYGIDHRLSRT
ncbi:MAG: Pr6Pr family membrane protein [Lachnospiraceae bacterium]|nr:Pr6Pr family membrane protein [Lachnospiraceae bacterium]